ncbi:DUF1624 domain-containing protein [Candidatus Bipolaricaulota bacterium]|nr:DUF1624 domain-containing protein [Candidatus Bipolaricaulota bacterium]
MKEKRFREIDLVRGLAVTGMVFYHVLFDLAALGYLDLAINTGPMKLFAEVTAATFFIVVGISLYISFSRAKKGANTGLELFRKYFCRGAKLLLWGGIVTGVTYLLYPGFAVIFGALQFIGVSVILAYFLLESLQGLGLVFRYAFLGLFAVIPFVVAGPIRTLGMSHRFLLWLGVTPPGFQSLDYFPLLPWFGFVAGGLILGELLYPEGERRFGVWALSNSLVEFLGRNSLIIYFFHQPLIYLGVFLFAFSTGQMDLQNITFLGSIR